MSVGRKTHPECQKNVAAFRAVVKSCNTNILYMENFQARSQACVSGVAKLSQKNHVVQNLRAYLTLMLSKSNV